MCCNCQSKDVRVGNRIPLDPGVNEVYFKDKDGNNSGFRNNLYTFNFSNLEGASITIGEQYPDRIKITSSGSSKISYIAYNPF